MRAARWLLPLVAATAWSTPLRVLIITGSTDEAYHHWRETTPVIRAFLERTGRFEVTVIEEPRAISSRALADYGVLVLNYHGPRLGADAEAAIENHVRAGGGLVAFHQASYGPFFGQTLTPQGWRMDPTQAWPAFAQMIGASWKPESIGHAPRGVFQVRWTGHAHPVSRGLAEAFTANDELYHKLTLASDIDVLADALDAGTGGTGRREPLIWTHRYGAGRVFYTTLGHDPTAWYQSGFQQAFARGVEWAATGEVAAATEIPKPLRVLAVTGGHPYPKEFYALLDSVAGIEWHHASNAEEAYARPLETDYDVVVLHDMPLTTTEQQRQRLRAFVEAGGGVVALHHAIVDYPDWPWWAEHVIGGRYFVRGLMAGSVKG